MKFQIKIFFFIMPFFVWAQQPLNELLEQYNTRSIPYISVEELRMQSLNEKIIILDTRELEEFEVSRIPTSHNIGFSNFSLEEFLKKNIEKNSPIVVYCSIGIRSEQIGEKLLKAGYTNVKNLYGGIFEWKNKGYAVLDSNGNNTENVHVCSKMWGKWLLSGNKIY